MTRSFSHTLLTLFFVTLAPVLPVLAVGLAFEAL